jgi:hypothetical protein
MEISKENDVSILIENAGIIDDEVQSTFGGLSAEQLNWKLNENVWSIAQCLDHLVITNNLYFENIQKVADGKHRNNLFSKIPFSTDIIGFVMKKVLSPDWKPKMKTLKMFKPSKSLISRNILENFSKNQSRFVALMEASKNLDYKKIKIAEPISKAVNLRLIDALEVLVVHEKRHFNQAKAIMKMKEFPK